MKRSRQQAFRFTLLVFFLFFAACVPKLKPVQVPEYKGTVQEFFQENSIWEGLSGSFELLLKKPGGQVLAADSFIETGPEKITMRFYRLGFPVGELEEKNPRYRALEEAIRYGLLWWQVNSYALDRYEETYTIKTDRRSLIMDRKTLVPMSQTIYIPGEGTVYVRYSDYRRLETLWFPYQMEITYGGYELDLKVTRAELKRR